MSAKRQSEPIASAGTAGTTPVRAVLAAAFAFAPAFFLAVAVGPLLGDPFETSDSSSYLRLASGLPAMMPFAARQLGPLLARATVHLGLTLHLAGLTLHGAYWLQALVALAFFLGGLAWLLVCNGAPRSMLVAVLGCLFWPRLIEGLVLPDLLFGALLCGFLLLLWHGRTLAAALMLFPLGLTRESAFLLLACLLAVGWRRLRWREILAAIASTGAAAWVVKLLSSHALANNEHISLALYLLAKTPWNGLKNFSGILPWANVYPACEVPAWRHALHLGPLHEIGYCGFDGRMPLRLACALLTSFGLLPLLLVWIWRPVRRHRSFREDGLLLRFCVVYGAFAFLTAGFLGASVERLCGYGWPLFFVALPLLVVDGRSDFRNRSWAAGFVAVHLLVSWAAGWLASPALLAVALAGWAVGAWLLRLGWNEAELEARPTPSLTRA